MYLKKDIEITEKIVVHQKKKIRSSKERWNYKGILDKKKDPI